MLAQSLINVQIDQFRKQLRPFSFPLKKFKNPKELQCVGFNLTEIDIILKKGHVIVSAGYEKIDNPDVEFCAKFEETMREGPMKAMKNIGKNFPEFANLAKGFGLDPNENEEDSGNLELPEAASEGDERRAPVKSTPDNTINSEL
jgi:hypothetical protein